MTTNLTKTKHFLTRDLKRSFEQERKIIENTTINLTNEHSLLIRSSRTTLIDAIITKQHHKTRD